MAAWDSGTTADVAVGLVLVALGTVAWRLRPTGRAGWLVAAAGGCWLLGDLTSAATFLHRGPLVHAVLGHPTGRPRGTAARVVVPLAYLSAAVYPLGRSDVATLALAAMVPAAAALDFARSSGPDRRARGVALVAAGTTAAALAVGPVSRLLAVGTTGTVLGEYDVLVLLAAGLLVGDLVRGRWGQDVATGLVLDLGSSAGTTGLRDRLARAIGDPDLVVGYWIGTDEQYVDELGHRVDLPTADAARAVTPVTQLGEPLAVLVHDRHVLADPALLADVAAAARFAVANARLQAEVRAKVTAVAASRRRLVTAADDERRQLEERLRLGAVGHLVEAEHLLAGADQRLAGLAGDVASARHTLRELALGLHPPALSSGDLATALRSLAARSPVPVTLDVTDAPAPPETAAAAYFVCAEAMTNIAKYSRAHAARIRLDIDRTGMLLVISDDGAGGADPARGTGLRGLVDRAEALGGALTVASPPGRGTTLTLRLPVTATVVAPHGFGAPAALAGSTA